MEPTKLQKDALSFDECLSLLPDTIRLGQRTDFSRIPLEDLSTEHLDDMAQAIRAICLDKLVREAYYVASQLIYRRTKEGILRVLREQLSKQHGRITRLVRFVSPDLALRFAGTFEMKLPAIRIKGGRPSAEGVYSYVRWCANSMKEKNGGIDYHQIGRRMISLFPHRFPERYRDAESVEKLGWTLVKRAGSQKIEQLKYEIEQTATRQVFENTIYIKAMPYLIEARTTPLYMALKRAKASSLLQFCESL